MGNNDTNQWLNYQGMLYHAPIGKGQVFFIPVTLENTTSPANPLFTRRTLDQSKPKLEPAEVEALLNAHDVIRGLEKSMKKETKKPGC